MQKTTTRLAGIDYKLGWSMQVYDDISEAIGIDYYHLRACVFNEINDINTGIGKPPAFYGDVKEDEKEEKQLYATIAEANKAIDDYQVQFDLEFNERMSKVISKVTAAKIFYHAAKSCNSLVEAGEIDQGIIDQSKLDEAVFNDHPRPGGGYLYLVVQFITWTYTQGQKEDIDEKKPGKGSFLKKFMHSLLI